LHQQGKHDMKPNDEFADIIEWKIKKGSKGETLLVHLPCMSRFWYYKGAAYRSGGMDKGVWLCSECFELAPSELHNVADLACEPLRKKRERSVLRELDVVKGLSWGKK